MSETGALARPDDRSNRTAKTASRRRIPGAGRQAPADSAGLGEAARRDAMARKLAEAQAVSQHDAPRGDHARSGASKVPARLRYERVPGAWRRAEAAFKALGESARRDAMARRRVHTRGQGVDRGDVDAGEGVGRGVATGEGVGSGDVDTGGGALAGDSRRSTLHASRKRPRPPARDRKLAERRLPPRR